MDIVSSQQDMMEMKLKQLGAKVQSIHGILCYVHFDVNGIEVSYAYNINAKEQFFLQRIRPYPIAAGVFPEQKEVVKFIKKDIKQFRNAQQTDVFDEIVDANKKLHLIMLLIEDLFLEYKVPPENVKQINDLLEQIEKEIIKARSNAEKIDIKS